VGARLEVAQGLAGTLLDGQLGGGDRVAVRVDGRVAELGRDELLELLGEDVLEDLGLGVDAIPWDVEGLGQVELEEPVMADDLQRDALAGLRELDALVRQVTPSRSARAFVVTAPSDV
jgi:hypothetical protein